MNGQQAYCYANDVVDSLKNYYARQGQEKMFNVPMIFRVRDSLGHTFEKEELGANVRTALRCSIFGRGTVERYDSVLSVGTILSRHAQRQRRGRWRCG